jgi:hypothetical protein
MLQPVNKDVEAGGEPLVAVVEPDMLAEGDQGGEAVGGQGAEELVQLGPGGGIADALLVDRGGRAADGKADGVVDQEEEGQAGFAVTEPSRAQRPRNASARAREWGPRGSRVLRIPATPGWPSSTARSR